MSVINDGRAIFDDEIKALELVRDNLGEKFEEIFNLIIGTKGKVVFTAVGKPGHIACKIAATFSSLGISSFYMHPIEAQHGDLGMLQKQDLVIAISFSGESSEVTKIIPSIKSLGIKVVGITGKKNSTLEKSVDVCEVFPHFDEAGYLKLAPTSSTTVALVYFDAMAIAISKYKQFDQNNFGVFHPAGLLGKKLLLKAKDIMVKEEDNAICKPETNLVDAISEMCGKPIGLLNVIDDKDKLLGVITDGDIRRAIQAKKALETTLCGQIMNVHPFVVKADDLLVDCLQFMVTNNVHSVPVLDDNRVVGTLQLKDIFKEGITL